MRKIINDPDNIVEEMMEGFIAAYHHMYYKHPEVNSVISRCRRKNKVSLIIGGGSGHEPMFSGFVGAGLADAACCGNILLHRIRRIFTKLEKALMKAKEFCLYMAVMQAII